MVKHFASLCTIIRDETNLEEFILYHWMIGFEHFYIYDNESSYPIKNRLQQYLFKKICTIIDFPGHSQQMNAFKHCFNNFGNDNVWIANIDGDEYIYPKKHWSIRDFLAENDHAHAIGINWHFFGTSFHNNIQKRCVIDAYRYCSSKQDQHIKTIYKPQYTNYIAGPHNVSLIDNSKYIDPSGNIISGPFNNNITNNIIQINHYFSRSLEDSYIKKNKPRADGTSYGQLLDNNVLHLLDNDIIDNSCADKYLPHLISMIYVLHTNWEIYKALNPDLQIRLKTPDEYYNHLFEHGLKENRHLKITDRFPSFNRYIYRSNYADLSYMNDVELEIHYINNGQYEGRICDRII